MSEVTKGTKEEAVATIKTESGKVVNVNELIAQVQEAEVGMEITADYLKFVEGEETRIIFVEMTKMKGMGEKADEMVDAVRCIGLDGRYKVNADTKLVSACRHLALKTTNPVALQVTHKGMIKGNNGKYADLEIKELHIKS